MSNATKVGLVTFMAILVLVFGLVWKSGLFIRAYGYRLYGDFETVSGLLLNAQVRYRGYLVGYVEDIDPGTRKIRVAIIIKKGIVLPANARLRVSFDGLIGEKYMDIIPQSPTDQVLKAGTVLQGYASKGLVDFVDVGTQNLEETKKILVSLREIMTSPEVESSIKNTILRVDSISVRFDTLLKSINQIASSPEVTGLKSSINNLNSFINELRSTLLNKGSVEDLRNVVNNADAAMKNVKLASDSFVRVMGNLDTITKDNGATSDIKAIIRDTKESMDSFKELLKDPAIKKTLIKTSETVDNTNKLLSAINTIMPYPKAEMYYRTYDKASFYKVGFGLDYGKVYSTLFDFSNRGGTNNLTDFQQGIRFLPNITGRVGLMRNLPGVGLDYGFNDNLLMSLDLPYDKNLNLDYRLKLKPFSNSFFDKVYFMLGGEMTFQKNGSLMFGLGF